MKKISVKILTMILCVALVSSFIDVSASASFDLSRDMDSVSKWTTLFQNASPNTAFFNAIPSFVGLSLPDVMWGKINEAISGSGGVGAVNEATLNNILAQYKNFFNKGLRDSFCKEISEWPEAYKNSFFFELMGLKVPVYDIQERPSGVLAIKDTANDVWVVNSSGEYPYVEKRSDGTSIDGDGNALSQWIGLGTVSNNISSKPVNMLSYSTLSALNALLIERGINCRLGNLGNYKAIFWDRSVYCDGDGRPYVCWANEDQSATNQERPDTVVKDEDGNIIQIEGDLSDNSTNIDLSNMTITMPDGKVFIADNILYDESTKTYNIDSHDVTNYNITYNYSWTYHINYTSITYIGQTEEYNKYYEVYYELPDGRDSADLTKEEVEQLNVSIDVIPYGRSADDTSLRSLYHFDGDTKDSSYWNYCTDFTWNKGASLTYMDAGVFNGALYLDETEHDFTLTLPSSIGSGDFTLQFRYYQSYTAAPQSDSYISFSGTQLIKFNGTHFLDGSGTTLAATPVGSWNEVCLMRKDSTLCVYLNGVPVSSKACSTYFGDTIQFVFGSDQQTFKYLDELRIVSSALYAVGSNYECTVVPYDSNLTLVLPDSAVPVADEYWNWTVGDTPLKSWNFESASLDFALPSISDFPSDGISFYGSSGKLSYSTSNDGLIITRSSSFYYTDGLRIFPTYFYYPSSYQTGYCDVYLYFEDRAPCLVRLKIYNAGSSNYTLSIDSMDSLPDNVSVGVDDSMDFLYIHPESAGSFVLSRIEMHQNGGQPSTAEFVSSVTPMTPDQLNTPTLAVRTDLDITSYQIGGVRPSLPTKGQVWALVENERITSIQIYNGSAWEGCDGRIWTGERWIPASSYNIITLQDMYDIVDATPNYEYIYTESGFWAWWQKAWIAFTDKLFNALGTGSGGSGGSSAPSSVKEALANALSTLIESLFAVITTVLQSLLGLVTDMLSFFFNFLTETVLGGISSFFSIFTDGSLTEWFQQTGEDGSTTTGLPSEIITAFSFISGVIMLLPAELRSVLFFGIGLMLLLAVFKLVKE